MFEINRFIFCVEKTRIQLKGIKIRTELEVKHT